MSVGPDSRRVYFPWGGPIQGHGIAFELCGIPGHGGRLPFFPARLGWVSDVHQTGVRPEASLASSRKKAEIDSFLLGIVLILGMVSRWLVTTLQGVF